MTKGFSFWEGFVPRETNRSLVGTRSKMTLLSANIVLRLVSWPFWRCVVMASDRLKRQTWVERAL